MQGDISDAYSGRDDMNLDSAELENELEDMINVSDLSNGDFNPMVEASSVGALPPFAGPDSGFLKAEPKKTQLPSTLGVEDVAMNNERSTLLHHMAGAS